MGRRNSNVSRSRLPSEREMLPELGARHPVVMFGEIEDFFADLRDNVMPKFITGASTEQLKGNERRGKGFTIYDDPERAGVTILERRLSRKYGQTHHLKWNRQDVGRIRGEIENEIGRMDLSDQSLSVTFDSVLRLGDIEASGNESKGRKLGLVADQTTIESEFLVREHEIAIDGISRSLKRFKYPYSTFVPHFTVARIDKNVPNEEMNQVIEGIGHLLPLQVDLLPIKFVSEQEV